MLPIVSEESEWLFWLLLKKFTLQDVFKRVNTLTKHSELDVYIMLKSQARYISWCKLYKKLLMIQSKSSTFAYQTRLFLKDIKRILQNIYIQICIHILAAAFNSCFMVNNSDALIHKFQLLLQKLVNLEKCPSAIFAEKWKSSTAPPINYVHSNKPNIWPPPLPLYAFWQKTYITKTIDDVRFWSDPLPLHLHTYFMDAPYCKFVNEVVVANKSKCLTFYKFVDQLNLFFTLMLKSKDYIEVCCF